MRWLLAVLLLAVAIYAACWPEKPTETALEVSHSVSSAPSRENLATEGTTTTAPPRTTVHRASRQRTVTTRARSAPHVTAAVVPVGGIQEAICNAFGRACAWALRVARCESGFNPRATNGSHRGLFQVSMRWHAARIARMGFTPDQMWEVGPNISVALAIYNEQGGGPWQCK